MKYIILSVLTAFCSVAFAQSTTKLGATELKLNDAICDCLSKQDLSNVSGREQGTLVYTECIGKNTDLLMQLAQERKVDIADQEAMRVLGLEIGKNLMTQNCASALQLGVKMNQDPNAPTTGSTEGAFKRIDVKGFNYVIITEAGKGERSFLWLEQFSGSEKFMGATTGLAGKKLKIKWKEIEAYLPEAKGYYKVKVITGVEML